MSRLRPYADVPMGWHLFIPALTLPPVARALGRSRRLSALATATLAAGAVWHMVRAVEQAQQLEEERRRTAARLRRIGEQARQAATVVDQRLEALSMPTQATAAQTTTIAFGPVPITAPPVRIPQVPSVDMHGAVIDGHHRWAWADQAGPW